MNIRLCTQVVKISNEFEKKLENCEMFNEFYPCKYILFLSKKYPRFLSNLSVHKLTFIHLQ